MLKGLFRGGARKPSEPEELSVDDLIVLERYEEAEERLKAKLKASPNDLHAHLKLADVFFQREQYGKAVDEYALVAGEYAQDGFYDRAVALLSRAAKLAPLDSSIPQKIDALQRRKEADRVRSLSLEGLRMASGRDAATALELTRLWSQLAASHVVQRLSGEQLNRLFSAMRLLRFEPGQVLAEEGGREGRLYLLVSGTVEVLVRGADGRETAVRSFGSGDVIGEAALLEQGSWPALYRVAEKAAALCLDREGLERTLQGNPDPRGFLEALREKHNDRDVAHAVRRLRSIS